MLAADYLCANIMCVSPLQLPYKMIAGQLETMDVFTSSSEVFRLTFDTFDAATLDFYLTIHTLDASQFGTCYCPVFRTFGPLCLLP